MRKNKSDNFEINYLENLRKETQKEITKSSFKALLDVFPSISYIVDSITDKVDLVKYAQEKHLLNTAIDFIEEIVQDNISPDVCGRILYNLSKYGEKEEERIMGLLNNMVDAKKGRLLGKLVVAVCKGLITCEEYKNYSELLNGLLYSDLYKLMDRWNKVIDGQGILFVDVSDVSFSRLSSFAIGERVIKMDTKNDSTDYSKTAIYRYDSYSQRFLNVLTDRLDSSLVEDTKEYSSHTEKIKEASKPFDSEDLDKVLENYNGKIYLDGGSASD